MRRRINNVIDKEIWIKAPVEDVFSHFTQPEAMLKWHGKEVELNPVQGGKYKVIFESGDEIEGEFIKLIPNKFISYSANYWDIKTYIEIHFFSENGGTTVKLRQEFGPDKDLSSFSDGWDYFLGILKSLWENKIDEKDCAHS